MNTSLMFIVIFALTRFSFCATIDSVDFDTFDFDAYFSIHRHATIPVSKSPPEPQISGSFVVHKEQPDYAEHLTGPEPLSADHQLSTTEHDDKENILSHQVAPNQIQLRHKEPGESLNSTVEIRTKRIKRPRNNSFAAENKAYDIVSRIPMTSDLTFCDQLSKNIHEFTDQYLFPQIPHHLDYMYTMYFVRTGRTPAEFLELMRRNDINIDISPPDLRMSFARYARKKLKKVGQKKKLSESDIDGWLGFSLPRNHLI